MNSLIFRYCVRFILPIMIFFSLFLLSRGHNYPGGGFIGGLVAAAAIALYYIANGNINLSLTKRWSLLLALGVSLLVLSLLLPVLEGLSPLTGIWWHIEFLGTGFFIGTPFIFDFGVYVLVIGSVVLMIQMIEA